MLGSSLQIPAVRDAGMGANTFTIEELDAIGAISPDEFAKYLSNVLSYARASAEQARVPLTQNLLMCTATPFLSELSHEQCDRAFTPGIGSITTGSKPVSLQHMADLEAAVLRVVHELSGASGTSLSADMPLMEAGVDSLAATELSSRLRSLTGAALSPTLVFEQPTPRAIAKHLLAVTSLEEAPSRATFIAIACKHQCRGRHDQH